MKKVKNDKIKHDLFLVNPESRALLTGERTPRFDVKQVRNWVVIVGVLVMALYFAFVTLGRQWGDFITLDTQGVVTPMEIVSVWASDNDHYVSYELRDPDGQFSFSGTQKISRETFDILKERTLIDGIGMLGILHLPGDFTRTEVALDFGPPNGQIALVILLTGAVVASSWYAFQIIRREWRYSRQGQFVYGQIIAVPQIVNKTISLRYVFASPQTGKPIEATSGARLQAQHLPHNGMYVAVQYVDDDLHRLL